MATLEVQPLVMKDIELEIELSDYRKHVSQVELSPKTSAITWTGMGRNTHTDQSSATWDCTLKYAQDWDSPDSLSRYLYEHEGETVDATFRPRSGVGPSFEVQLAITPGAIGGVVNAFAETSVTLGVNGRPVLVEIPTP